MSIVGAILRLAVLNAGLAYYWLPRSWRGGYRSPWDLKRAILE
jgi:hypothetical protein